MRLALFALLITLTGCAEVYSGHPGSTVTVRTPGSTTSTVRRGLPINMNADLLIGMVLNEGRKIPLRPHVGGRKIPKFGRKARRFGSKAPILDKGGELSVTDRFGVTFF